MGFFVKWVFSRANTYKNRHISDYTHIYKMQQRQSHKTSQPHQTSYTLLLMGDTYNKQARTLVIDSVLTVRVAAMVKYRRVISLLVLVLLLLVVLRLVPLALATALATGLN